MTQLLSFKKPASFRFKFDKDSDTVELINQHGESIFMGIGQSEELIASLLKYPSRVHWTRHAGNTR